MVLETIYVLRGWESKALDDQVGGGLDDDEERVNMRDRMRGTCSS